jgi:hypothetical protein
MSRIYWLEKFDGNVKRQSWIVSKLNMENEREIYINYTVRLMPNGWIVSGTKSGYLKIFMRESAPDL